MPTNNMRPIHPGEILREEYLAPLEMSANALAIKLQGFHFNAYSKKYHLCTHIKASPPL